jgi:carbamoyltransferase
MIIVGIMASHDGTLTVFKDGINIFSIGEERLNRIKSYIGFPFQALRYIIENEVVKASEIDAIALDGMAGFFKYMAWTYGFEFTEDKLYYDISNEKEPDNYYINDERYKFIKDKKSCEEFVRMRVKELCKELGIDAPIHFFKHHTNHAASAYYTSGFSEALAITMDGQGDDESATVSICRNGRIEKLSSTTIDNSAGYLYSAVTRKCGFKAGRHEGKITGLAAYGDYKKNESCFNELVKVEDGKLQYINAKNRTFFNKVIRKVMGIMGKEYLIGAQELIERCGELSKEDLSASIQHLLEIRIVEIVDYWIKKTGIKNVVLSGGVFANVKFNQRISEISELENLYIYPDMGDGGNAFGAAANLYYQTNEYIPEATKTKNVYYGPEFSNHYIKSMLEQVSDKVEYYLSEDTAKDTANLLANNNIVGWFQGRMEYGPRALGNRSIIASPVDATINQWLNDRLKRNEFMPFAPSCLYEYADELFDIPKESLKFPAQFMTITFKMKKKWADKAPAVSHVDQTARPQLVTKEANPKYHQLLTEYNKLTGLPLFINTSFNVHEEPIVCKPEEGLKALLTGVIDRFVCGDYICKLKKEI